MLQLVSICW